LKKRKDNTGTDTLPVTLKLEGDGVRIPLYVVYLGVSRVHVAQWRIQMFTLVRGPLYCILIVPFFLYESGKNGTTTTCVLLSRREYSLLFRRSIRCSPYFLNSPGSDGWVRVFDLWKQKKIQKDSYMIQWQSKTLVYKN